MWSITIQIRYKQKRLEKKKKTKKTRQHQKKCFLFKNEKYTKYVDLIMKMLAQ